LGQFADVIKYRLSVAEKVARDPVSRTEKKDGEDYPLAIFQFYYRSQGMYYFSHVVDPEICICRGMTDGGKQQMH
jgi:hypothetical protein